MSVKTEGKHAGEFLLSEAPGTLSRESCIVSSGQTVEDGQVVTDDGSGSEFVVATGSVNSEGVSDEAIAGILIVPGGSPVTLTADTKFAYIARLAEVKASSVKLHDDSSDAEDAAVIAALAAKNIVLR